MIGVLTMVFFLTPINSLNNQVQVSRDEYATYQDVILKSLNNSSIEKVDNLKAFTSLNSGHITEAFDVEAKAALETGLAKYWYPHYLATVVLVIDKDQVSREVLSWQDLNNSKVEVGFLDSEVALQMQVAAMTFGLEGDNYTLDKAIYLLSKLKDQNLLKMQSAVSPITICFDYQAVNLKENKHNLEIIIPSDGSFTFQKGLLANEELSFNQDLDKLLLENNFRLLNHQSNQDLYPQDKDYKYASEVLDNNHFSKISQKTERLIERQVLNNKPFTSIDNYEHLIFAILYLIIVTAWTASVSHRATQKGIAYASLLLGITLNNWTLVRLVKYQIIAMPTLTRYLWYSFYIFQLAIPLIILWMSWAIDKPKDIIMPPNWLKILAFISILMVFFVFTNDLHGLVFKLDLSRSDWDINYTYGVGYYVVLIFGMTNLFLAFLIQVVKSFQNPQKKSYILPLIIFGLYGLYTYKYIKRDPFVYNTDLTIVTGLFAMLMFEICIRTGLIPVNSKYIDLFKQSPIKLQIFDNHKNMVLASGPAMLDDEKVIDEVLRPDSPPILYKDTLIMTNTIPGGYAVWYEDIETINKLFNEIIESSAKLKDANKLLEEESYLQKKLNQQLAKKELNREFEEEIAQSINHLSEMVDNLDSNLDNKKALMRTTLLLTYIKRKSNLFFLEKQAEMIDVKQLVSYIDELAQISNYSSTQIAIFNEVENRLPSHYVTIFYDFFYQVLMTSINKDCPYLINYFESNSGYFTMRLLPSQNLKKIKFEEKLASIIEVEQGIIEIKNVEDSVGISLSLKKEGAAYDKNI